MDGQSVGGSVAAYPEIPLSSQPLQEFGQMGGVARFREVLDLVDATGKFIEGSGG